MFELLEAALPTLGVLAVLLLSTAIAGVVAVVLIGVPRSQSVGRRARRHAELLATLPSFSHPDAAGHVRSRAPGGSPAVA